MRFLSVHMHFPRQNPVSHRWNHGEQLLCQLHSRITSYSHSHILPSTHKGSWWKASRLKQWLCSCQENHRYSQQVRTCSTRKEHDTLRLLHTCMHARTGLTTSSTAAISLVSSLQTFLVPMTTSTWRTAMWYLASFTSAFWLKVHSCKIYLLPCVIWMLLCHIIFRSKWIPPHGVWYW